MCEKCPIDQRYPYYGFPVTPDSRKLRDEAGDVPLLDWKAEGLLKPSLVRCSQRFYFNRSELLQWFGRLSLRDAEHVND